MTKKEAWKWLSNHILNLLWVSIVLILVSIILTPYGVNNIFIRLMSSLFEVLGVSLFIAAAFSYISSTEEFMSQVEKLLKNIVIKREFLGNLDVDSKKNAIFSIIKPTKNEDKLYSNFDDYYKTYINKTLEVSKKGVRSDYRVDANIFFDVTKNSVVVKSFITYRVYPAIGGYTDIKIGFMDFDQLSKVNYIRIYNKDKRKDLSENDLIFENIETEVGKVRMTKVSLQDIGEKSEFLNVEIEMIEYGHDHWILVGFQALEPTDGFIYKLTCEGDLAVCEYQTFVFGAKFFIEKSDNCNKEMILTCGEWINEGSGLAVVVSKPKYCIPVKDQPSA